MIAWMMWSILFAALLALAAVTAERIAGHYGVPRRFIWLAAIIVGAIAPAVLAWQPARLDALAASRASATVPSVQALDASGSPPMIAAPLGRALTDPHVLDVWALRIWLVLSLSVLGTFAHATYVLRRQRAGWLEMDLTICHALVTTDVGPAVVGFLRPRIVVPRWALSVDKPTRLMILRHELEHLRAHDPQALLLSGIVLIVFPWNLPLWWIVRRLRLAMELDCDARVVRSLGTAYDYGRVLLAVGERHAGSLPLAASLTGRRPFLERRITAMMMKKPRHPLIASLPFATIALVALIAATRAPHPAPLRRLSSPAATGATSPTPEAVAAMLLGHVPSLSEARDSATYGVMVLDANGNFVTAAAGYGNLVVQVWGDTSQATSEVRKSTERTVMSGRGGVGSSEPGERARSGGGGRGARGGGAGRGDPAPEVDIPSDAIRRGQWRTMTTHLAVRGPNGDFTSFGGPANGYVAGLAYQRGPDPATGAERVSPINSAPGLHLPASGGQDDSGIDGIPASALVSLESFNIGSDLVPRHDLSVIVVTTKGAGAVR